MSKTDIRKHILMNVCTLTHNRQMTRAELQQMARISYEAASNTIGTLKRRGHLGVATRGKYYITRLGMDEIPEAIREEERKEASKKST